MGRALCAVAVAFSALTFSAVTFSAATWPAVAEDVAVEATSHTVKTACAESDNVDIRFTSAEIRRFRISAVHPPYIGTLGVDRTAPDFTACDMSRDAAFAAPPRRVTLWESSDWWLVGFTFPAFWRPNTVPVRVDRRIENGLHLLQLWRWHKERAEEVLVLYPADGYWRARPLPPAHLRANAYGSSFLIGPVEVQGRPLVDLRSVTFEPTTRSFTLEFTRSGSVSVAIEHLDEERIVLDVTLSSPLEGPVAAIRSMYVTDSNADVSKLDWRSPNEPGWKSGGILAFDKARVLALRAGRDVPSRHNTSAPDLVFDRFAPR